MVQPGARGQRRSQETADGSLSSNGTVRASSLCSSLPPTRATSQAGKPRASRYRTTFARSGGRVRSPRARFESRWRARSNASVSSSAEISASACRAAAALTPRRASAAANRLRPYPRRSRSAQVARATATSSTRPASRRRITSRATAAAAKPRRWRRCESSLSLSARAVSRRKATACSASPTTCRGLAAAKFEGVLQIQRVRLEPGLQGCLHLLQ